MSRDERKEVDTGVPCSGDEGLGVRHEGKVRDGAVLYGRQHPWERTETFHS